MRHPDDLIRRYLDGELSPMPAADLRAHLAGCDHCRRRLATLERLDAQLRDLERLAPPRDFAARVRGQVAALPPLGRAARWQWPLAAALALGGVLSILPAADQFFSLFGGLLAAAGDQIGWLLGLLAGELLPTGGLGIPGAEPALVVGLCMIGIAGLLVLRGALENFVEA